MKILIPMAGAGSRFTQAGYAESKPLIDVEGLPMIVRVIDNLPKTDDYVFIVRKDVHDVERLKNLLMSLKPKCQIIEVEKLTQGAAETCLLAKEFINNNAGLLIANCDQIQQWDIKRFEKTIVKCQQKHQNFRGLILTFKSDSPKNSYVTTSKSGHITLAVEKQVISERATTGVYYWAKGSDFVSCAEQMIADDIRTNNEFYVCPVYNYIIKQGGIVLPHGIKKHWPIGTPEDLEVYLNRCVSTSSQK